MAIDPKKKQQLEEMGLPAPENLDADFEVKTKTPEEVAEPAMEKALKETEEQITTPEQQPEKVAEKKVEQTEEKKEKEEVKQEQPEPTPAPQVATAPVVEKDPELQQIENIMQENLEEPYQKMTPAQKERFRKEGEQTATKIQKLLRKSKVKMKKVVQLLTKWLQLIPGVNRYFLEQEAKIKADKIVDLKERE